MGKKTYNIGVTKQAARLRKFMHTGQYGNAYSAKKSVTTILSGNQQEVDTTRFMTWEKFADFFRRIIHTDNKTNTESTHIRAIHPLEDSQGEPYATEKYVTDHATEIIGTDDETVPTDTNVFSALRARAEFMRRGIVESVKHLWSFLMGIHIGDYISGSRGASIDEAGNAEVESIFVRSCMKVMELIYNRINAVEGDTTFADSGVIDSLDGNTAVMRKRWDGDFTSFQPGDIVYGYVNDMGNTTAKTYYRAWAWVRRVNRDDNSLELMRYADTDVPGGKNFAVTAGMRIAKFGNNLEPNAENATQYPTVIKNGSNGYTNVRQSCFYISTEQGCIIQYTGVNSPRISRENYGTILGRIPDGALAPEIMEKLNSDHPYMYSRGVLVQDLIRIGYEGVPVRTANYRGQWSEDTAQSSNEYYRYANDTYDTVTWRGAMWQCVSEHADANEPDDSNASWARMTSVETAYQPNLLSGTRSGVWDFSFFHGTASGIAYELEIADGRREDVFTQTGSEQTGNWHTAYITAYCEALEAGKEYEVSFDCKGVGAKVSFAVTLSGPGITYPGSVATEATEVWRRCRMRFTMPEGKVLGMALTVSLRGAGEMRMRDIMVAPRGYAKWSPSYNDLKGEDGKDGTDGIPGTNGKDGKDGKDGTDGIPGKNSYLHIAYAKNDYKGNLPHPTSLAGFSTVPFDGSGLIGVYVDETKADSTDHSKYAWSVYKGYDGKDGANGKDGKDGKDGANGKDGYGLRLVTNVTANEEKWQRFEKASGNDNGYSFSRGGDTVLATITANARADVRQGDYFQCVGKATDSGNYHKTTFVATNDPGSVMRGEYVCHETSMRGETGVMVYPAGVYSSSTSYSASSSNSPVVYYNGEYYYLKPGLTWAAGQTATPASNSATGDAASWVRMDKFNSVYAEVLFAEFGKLGNGIFWGEWFFSSKGSLNDAETDDYSTFNGSFSAGTFIPHWAVNLSNGKFYTFPTSADSIGIEDGILKAGQLGRRILLSRSGMIMEGDGGSVDWSVASRDSNGMLRVKATGNDAGALFAYAAGNYSRSFHSAAGVVSSNNYMGSYGVLALEGSGLNYGTSIRFGTWLLKSTGTNWLQVALPTARNVARWIMPAVTATSQLPDFAVRLTIVCSRESVVAVSIRPPEFAPDGDAWKTRYLSPSNVMELLLVNTQSGYRVYNINGGGSANAPT